MDKVINGNVHQLLLSLKNLTTENDPQQIAINLRIVKWTFEDQILFGVLNAEDPEVKIINNLIEGMVTSFGYYQKNADDKFRVQLKEYAQDAHDMITMDRVIH
jgi:hypothetical protein